MRHAAMNSADLTVPLVFTAVRNLAPLGFTASTFSKGLFAASLQPSEHKVPPVSCSRCSQGRKLSVTRFLASSSRLVRRVL
jgi:hypothetical protein